MSKGVSQVATAAIYVGITVSAISVALTAGVPALQNLQDSSAISQAQQFMQQLDGLVQQVASEGEGSTRTISTNIDRGTLYFQNSTKTLIYELETDADVISPQTTIREGNVLLSSNANVKVEETAVGGVSCYLMENEHIRTCIKNVGSQTSQKNISSSELIQVYEFKREDGTTRPLNPNMTIEINSRNETSAGVGYTTVDSTGDFIGTGQVTARIFTDGLSYDVIFRLPTGSDFMRIDVQNYQ